MLPFAEQGRGLSGGKISTKTPDKRKICICSANTFLIRMSLSLTSHYSGGLADGVLLPLLGYETALA